MVAWLPDIIGSLLANRPLQLIEVYTTEITYVLDMGIISPLAFLTIYLLRNRSGMGFVLLLILLSLCLIIGVMIPTQTVFQILADISVPIPALITKAGIFILLALFALYLIIKSMQAIKA